MKTRFLLVDDHRVVLDGLTMLLGSQEDMEVVGQADNGRAALEIARDIQPDVVVMDVTMPGLGGAGATRDILRLPADTKVVALSMHASRQFVEDMVEAGVSGYVVKSAPVQEVLEAIRAVRAGRQYFSPEIKREVPTVADPSAPSASQAATLTEREREVLQLVAEGHSSKEIAAILHVSTKTVQFHRQSIMDKLEIRSVAELTKFAIRQGRTTLEP